jgi:death-on-curing protein
MADIYYLSLADVLALHEMVMARTGDTPAPLRDEGLLESAVMRPRMAAHYEQADLLRQCALLTIGISQAQAFLDGNKRTAFAACDVFLRLNGLAFEGDPLALARQLEGVAERSGQLEEATRQFEAWLREQIGQRDRR